MPKREVWDVLKLKREAEDGSRYYTGRRGVYLFQFTNGGVNGRTGKVILNRKFLTGLFRSKFSAKVVRYCGDCREERKFLLFDRTAKDEITVYSTPKNK